MKPDEVLKACAAKGGVIGIEAAPHTTLTAKHPQHSLESVVEHVAYCVEVMGIDHVGLGPDTSSETVSACTRRLRQRFRSPGSSRASSTRRSSTSTGWKETWTR
jgi:microsomal dipeptidase-like Zn-dependent dipeptidase